jgi:hypothetical protein
MIVLPRSEYVAYIQKFGIAAIYIAGPQSGRAPCMIGSTVDLARTLGSVRRKWSLSFAEPPLMLAAWWSTRWEASASLS